MSFKCSVLILRQFSWNFIIVFDNWNDILYVVWCDWFIDFIFMVLVITVLQYGYDCANLQSNKTNTWIDTQFRTYFYFGEKYCWMNQS